MPTPTPTPPPLAERLLAAALPDTEWRDSITGDLREEYASEIGRHGRRAARKWYWRQVLSIASRAVATRFGARRVRSRSWMAPPAPDERASRLAGLLRDLAFAWRNVVHRPALSGVIVVTLALALVANSTIFALFDAIVLRPYRFTGVDRLVVVASSTTPDLLDRESVAPADYRDWRREAGTLTQLTAMEWWNANLSGIDQPEQIAGFRVTAEFFDALGAPPIIGRGFLESEETRGRHRRAVLGHDLWTRRFGADPGIVGRTVRLDGEPHEVVGIAPPEFAIPLGSQIWAPLAPTAEEWSNRRGTSLTVFGRLKDGVTIEQARAEMGAIVERLRRQYPDTNANRPVQVVDFIAGMSDPGASRFLSVWQTAAILLLLIACANVANLLLARGAERSQEIAIRLALGAGRARIVGQMLIEGALYAALAVALAVPLTYMGLGVARAAIPASIIRFIPGWKYIEMNAPLFAGTALLAAAALLLFAVTPAVRAAREGVSETLRQTGRSVTASRTRHRGRNVLATAQVALSLAMLFVSGLMLTASETAVNGALGYDKRDLLTALVTLPEQPYADADKRRQFITGVLERLRAMPAVSSAAMVSNMPSGGNNSSIEFWPEGEPLEASDVRQVFHRRISDDYFATLRIPLLAGRAFNTSDRPHTEAVAVVSRALADQYWPGRDPIGRRFRRAADGPLITVVGVVGDVRHDWFRGTGAPTLYRPMSQDVPYRHHLVVRTAGEPMAVAPALRRAVTAMDPDQPVTDINTMENALADRAAGITFIAQAVGVLAVIAFVFAITGLYSLMAFIAAQRTQEFGVRLALGAGRWQVIALTTRQAFAITAVGAVIGTAIAAGLGRMMESLLFGVVVNSYEQLATLAAALMFVALVAAYLPARRAAGVDPTVALRAD
jgi:putative ABC transport system permease protein